MWYREEGPGRAAAAGLPGPPTPLLAVPNVTAHPSTASVLTSYYSIWHTTFALKRVKPKKRKLLDITNKKLSCQRETAR